MKNFRRSRKALSPVVASIILIAVTVAVSIAVAAWMGGLTMGFMSGTEQVEIRSIAFPSSNTIAVTIKNTATSSVAIQEVWVNSAEQLNANLDASHQTTFSVAANGVTTLTISNYAWTAGDNYQIKIVTAKGNVFMKNALAV